MKKNLCPLIFHHSHVRPDGQIYPCCYFEPKNLPKDLNIDNPNWFNHEFLQQIRERNRDNKPVFECSKCYTDELFDRYRDLIKDPSEAEKLKYSLRIEKLKVYQEKDHKEFSPPESASLRSLDIALSNVCNNKCRMCGPELSTYWYPDAQKLGIPFNRGIIDNTEFLQNNDFSQLFDLKVVGGEPMLEQEKLKILLGKCNRSQLEIQIITNCTVLPDQELEGLLKECRKVKISLSIDAYGKLNEYLRKGSHWTTTVNNIDYYSKNFPYVEIYSVINIYNANVVEQLPNFIRENYPNIHFAFAMIDKPEWMTLKHIPFKNKSIILERILQSPNQTVLNTFPLVKRNLHFKGDPRLFIDNNSPLDKIRNETLEQVNPELAEWLIEYSIN